MAARVPELPRVDELDEAKRVIRAQRIAEMLARWDSESCPGEPDPVTTATWRDAAWLWAHLRRTGQPTADGGELDGGVIIAAQARAEDATVITANARHLARLVPVLDWTAVPTGSG